MLKTNKHEGYHGLDLNIYEQGNYEFFHSIHPMKLFGGENAHFLNKNNN